METIRQELTFVGSEYGKLVALRNLFTEGLMPPILIFVQTKERAQQLFLEMLHDKRKVDVIHSGRDRKEVSPYFRKWVSNLLSPSFCREKKLLNDSVKATFGS